MTTNTNPMELFFKKYDAIANELPYNPKWENGTGYLDYTVKGEDAPTLVPGTMYKSVTEAGRKIILIGTKLGNVVLFQRFTDREDVIIMHGSEEIYKSGLLNRGNLATQEVMHFILGYWDWDPHIGEIVDNIIEFYAKQTS